MSDNPRPDDCPFPFPDLSNVGTRMIVRFRCVECGADVLDSEDDSVLICMTCGEVYTRSDRDE